MPIGQVTRGTTGTNRLRRMDRWIASAAAVATAGSAGGRPRVRRVGDHRDRAAAAHPRASRRARDLARAGREREAFGERRRALRPRRVRARRGSPPMIVRAANVLRQYKEEEVLPAWREMVARLQSGGLVIDGTCNEVGRLATWVAVGADGPRTLTVASLHFRNVEEPSELAERLPKILIHSQCGGEAHPHVLRRPRPRVGRARRARRLLPSQRWIAAVRSMKDADWPITGGVRRWRLGELTVAWDAVSPSGFRW